MGFRVGTELIVRDRNLHRKRLLALCALAPLMAGCSGATEMLQSDLLSRDAQWFSRTGRLFIRSVSIETPPLDPGQAGNGRRSRQRRRRLPGNGAGRGPADANAPDRRGGGAPPSTSGNGGARTYRMRRRARHRRARQCQPVQQSARRPGRGRDVFRGRARRHLHLYRGPADARSSAAPNRWRGRGRQSPRRRRNRARRDRSARFLAAGRGWTGSSSPPHRIAYSPPATLPRRAAARFGSRARALRAAPPASDRA